MNCRIVLLFIPFYLSSCGFGTQFYKINPAFQEKCHYDKIIVSKDALVLKQPQAWLQDLEHLDGLYTNLYAQLNTLKPRAVQSFDSLLLGDSLIPVQFPWKNELWFRAAWPSYTQLGLDSNRILLLHRLDLGAGLDSKLLYSAGQKDASEDARDTLEIANRIWPKQIQLWTCWTLWNGTLAQYERYGCFPVEYSQAQAKAWDTILKQTDFFASWNLRLNHEVCGD